MKTWEKTEEVVVKHKLLGIFCDKCGLDITEEPNFKVHDFTLTYYTGVMFPEGGGGTKWYVEDICPNCVEDLHQLLKNWGVNIKEGEWDA